MLELELKTVTLTLVEVEEIAEEEGVTDGDSLLLLVDDISTLVVVVGVDSAKKESTLAAFSIFSNWGIFELLSEGKSSELRTIRLDLAD